jgi:hypothetical protein
MTGQATIFETNILIQVASAKTNILIQLDNTATEKQLKSNNLIQVASAETNDLILLENVATEKATTSTSLPSSSTHPCVIKPHCSYIFLLKLYIASTKSSTSKHKNTLAASIN